MRQMSGIPGTRVVAYTYDADHHCTGCAEREHGTDERGFIPESARDSEGNEIHAVFVTDLDNGPTVEACSDCQSRICLACGLASSDRIVLFPCWNCGTEWVTESE